MFCLEIWNGIHFSDMIRMPSLSWCISTLIFESPRNFCQFFHAFFSVPCYIGGLFIEFQNIHQIIIQGWFSRKSKLIIEDEIDKRFAWEKDFLICREGMESKQTLGIELITLQMKSSATIRSSATWKINCGCFDCSFFKMAINLHEKLVPRVAF